MADDGVNRFLEVGQSGVVDFTGTGRVIRVDGGRITTNGKGRTGPQVLPFAS